jgi:hypothetical protein
MTVAAVAVTITTAGVAHARTTSGPVILYQDPQSIWLTYKTTGDRGNPLCGMMAVARGGKGSAMTFNLKNMTPDDDGLHDGGLFFMIGKAGWKFPKGDGVEVPLAIGFDDKPDEIVTATAGGYADDKMGPVVKFTVEERQEGQAQAFLEMLAHADTMWIKFKAGNEKPWTIDMRGTRGAVSALRHCFAKLPNTTATQPYSSAPDTQPFSLDPKSVKTTKGKQGRDI